jgi:hypothetical protein
VLVPILGKGEMGMPVSETLLARLQQVPKYRSGFREAFKREVNLLDVQWSIAAFERTLVTPASAFDRYAAGDKQALTDPQKRGLILFIGKAACRQCHSGPNFTDNKFHSLGLLSGQKKDPDVGRFAISKSPADRGAFKTPSLRSVRLQSHFMHNGFFRQPGRGHCFLRQWPRRRAQVKPAFQTSSNGCGASGRARLPERPRQPNIGRFPLDQHEVNTSSASNELATDPPVIADQDGTAYGRLRLNRNSPTRILNYYHS